MDERGIIRPTQENVSPLKMEALLRDVVQTTVMQDQPSYTILPYLKPIGGFPAVMVVRAAVDEEGDKSYSVDVGILNAVDQALESVAYVDFKEQGRIVNGDKVAVVSYKKPTEARGMNVIRDNPSSDGIHVIPAMRRNGLATSLISATRIILDEEGIKMLLMKEIRTGDGPGGHFYRNLGGAFFEDWMDDPEYGWESQPTHMFLPTRSSPRMPYMFS